jgi:3-methylcrotonyl-CoA carboxylase alpha subunit
MGGDVPIEALVAAAARLFFDEMAAIASAPASPWNDTHGWRLNQRPLRKMELKCGDRSFVLEAEERGDHARVRLDGKEHRVAVTPGSGDRLQVTLDEETYFANVVRLGDLVSATTPQGRYDLERVDPFHYEPADALPDARLTALMPGRVVKVLAKEGDKVAKGQSLMILEAMKMEHTIASPREGVIERVAFRENDLVPADAVLVAFRE